MRQERLPSGHPQTESYRTIVTYETGGQHFAKAQRYQKHGWREAGYGQQGPKELISLKLVKAFWGPFGILGHEEGPIQWSFIW